MKEKQKQAVEVTTFKLNGYSCRQFIGANAEVDAFLKRQPGFNQEKSSNKAG
jgi:hypothetical protein